MAHHKSAQKRIRQTVRRSAVNTARVGRVRTFIKKVEMAIAGGDRAKAQDALRQAEPEMMRGAHKGIVKKNTMSRRISRLSKRINGMPA
ncbi:MAG: 30S ribosomal protein S20 [Proteobacteria bacterium]|nr:30S ribosomal protein S20 [Pseudomonadota bacterium]MDA1058096.1 30S ribosomal protein S20 [Pseudomonadota bacterium]